MNLFKKIFVTAPSEDLTITERAEGCLMGLMCGDALGAPIEFHSPYDFKTKYPHGIHDMENGWGVTYHIRKGEITDDSEMAICLLHSLVKSQGYNKEEALAQYKGWLASGPSDVGITIRSALRGSYNPDSQANGALMRVAPIAIHAAFHPESDWQAAAADDCALTHINGHCQCANIVYVESLMLAIQGKKPEYIYAAACNRAKELQDDVLVDLLQKAVSEEPAYYPNAGWLNIAFQAAYYWLLHAKDYPSAMRAIVNKIGDPDTNAAIVGALLGAIYGRRGIPARWQSTVLDYENDRPAAYHATTAMELLTRL